MVDALSLCCKWSINFPWEIVPGGRKKKKSNYHTALKQRATVVMYLLEAPVEVSGRAGHDGFNEEGLLAVALFVAPHYAEAPAVVVGLQQDDVPAPVHVTGMTKEGDSNRSTLSIMCTHLLYSNDYRETENNIRRDTLDALCTLSNNVSDSKKTTTNPTNRLFATAPQKMELMKSVRVLHLDVHILHLRIDWDTFQASRGTRHGR